jgi:hypothetical protein
MLHCNISILEIHELWFLYICQINVFTFPCKQQFTLSTCLKCLLVVGLDLVEKILQHMKKKDLQFFLIFLHWSETLERLWSAEWVHCSYEWSRYWFRSLTFYQILTDDQIPFFHDCHIHDQYLCYHGLHGQGLVLNHDLSGEHHFLIEDHHDLSTLCWNKTYFTLKV